MSTMTINEKKYSISTKTTVWGCLAAATIILGLLILFGVPIPAWVMLLPLGIPIVSIIFLPSFLIFAILAVAVVILGLLTIGLIPVMILMFLFGAEEVIDSGDRLVS